MVVGRHEMLHTLLNLGSIVNVLAFSRSFRSSRSANIDSVKEYQCTRQIIQVWNFMTTDAIEAKPINSFKKQLEKLMKEKLI